VRQAIKAKLSLAAELRVLSKYELTRKCEMKKNTVSSIFILGVVLISLFLLTAYRPDFKSVPAAGVVANHQPLIVNPADRKFSYTAYHVTADVEAADLSAARWQAMGDFYEKQGMLTRDNFDYVSAADLSAARWQAMGDFYEEQGMLTRDNFDYEQAADLSAARWQAMGEFYEEQGMLTRDNFDYEQAADLSAARWQAMGEYYVEQASGTNYAMDTVDLKLFNSAQVSPSTMAAEGAGIVYAMDPVSLKLFNSAETASITVAAR
jgi:uncharacterized protein affecting Mg2+/Co2+ transport